MDNMLVDDLNPNDGSTVYEPVVDEAVAREDGEEKALYVGAVAIRDEIMTWINTEIAHCDSIDNLEPGSTIPLDSQVLAAKSLKALLQGVASRLEIGFDAHTR